MKKVPVWPQKTDTEEVRQRLAAEDGLKLTWRMVNRDLHKLERQKALILDDQHVPHGWSQPEEGAYAGADMDTAAAVLFHLVERVVMWLLPAFMRRSLAPWMREAERVLAAMSSKPRAEFASKVRFLPVGPPLFGPKVNQRILDVAAEALYRGRKLAAMYAPRGQTARPYTLHPLGLVVKGPVLILVAWAEERMALRTMALHRFEALAMLDGAAETPPGFDLDEYIAEGGLGMKLSGAPIEIEVRFHPDLTPDFAETRLAEDQILTTDPDGWGRVRAVVFDTFELRGWLLRFADRVAVVGPPPLRAEFARMILGMSAHYVGCVPAPGNAGPGA